MIILGIETSCDETAAAVLHIKNGCFRVLSNVVSSSVELQAKYGGVVPEVAARKQVEYIIPVLGQALKEDTRYKIQDTKNSQFSIPNFQFIDYIAVTNGPGLITSLRVGVEAGRTLSYVWNKPLILVDHLEGHIYANAISNFQFPISNKIPNNNFQKLREIKFPALILIVSGGHTQLVLMKDYLKYKIIGETKDDAAGEAFDKAAKMMNLGYPGGPEIARLAKKGDPLKIDMPRPMINSGDYNFSFSGIKTAVFYKMKERRINPHTKRSCMVDGFKSSHQKTFGVRIKKQDMCASFQKACVEVLVSKTLKAAQEFKVKTILLGGGVAANERLRDLLKKEVSDRLDKVELFLPDIKMTGDNAVMIALAGYYKIKAGKLNDWRKVKTDANLRLGR
ncbi:MAG: tRNA (adenosine(37)-N6)-threonylcarbamoyltransferase complex transferase subunit TsaD [Candidatus Kuenenbacteria bacterium]